MQAMAASAEPDALLHHVATQLPELLPEGALPSKMHAYTAWVCQLANKHGVELLIDRLTLLVSACATKGNSLSNKANLSLLENKTYQPGQLSQLWTAQP